MDPGDEIEITIDTVAFGGAGVGRYGKMVVFVPFTVDGDTVTVKISSMKKRFATAELQFVHAPSPFRVSPRCAAYTRCGACTYQHIAYDNQVIIKRQQVHDALKRIGKFDNIPVEETIPSPQIYGYRGKADFHVSTGKAQERVIGFAARATNDIVDLERCEVVHESINNALRLMKQQKPRAGRWSLWSLPANEDSESRIVRQVKGREMLVPRDGFFQANLYLTDTLVNVVEECCSLSGTETVIDGYCGSGLFSLFLAPRCGRLYGIEANGVAVRCAEENLKRAGINSAVFYTGDVARILRERFIHQNMADVILLDPPRIGLEPDTIAALGVLKPPKIVYVSCNPATLARDFRMLKGFGYNIIRVQPIDMFPQTSHIETVVLLKQAPTA
jgi:23S rRNA (uracil1939-C5)-methyltransferase